MKQLESQKAIPPWVVFLIVVLALAFIVNIIVYAINEYDKLITKEDRFCMQFGFNKSTGFKFGCYNSDDETMHSQIECDKSKIFSIECKYACIKYDKWGECVKGDYSEYSLSNYTKYKC